MTIETRGRRDAVGAFKAENDTLEKGLVVYLWEDGQFTTDGGIQHFTSWDTLTEREQEVTALACMGYRNYEIGEALGISHETVKTHLQNIFNKFNIRNRNELRRALRDWQFQEWWDSHQS